MKKLTSAICVLFMLWYPCHADEVQGAEDIFDIPTWGYVLTDNNPWMLTVVFGWVFLSPESSPDGYWVWIEDLGWIYSSQDRFPEVYIYRYISTEQIGWSLLDLTDTTRFKFFSQKMKAWLYLPRPNIDSNQAEVFGLVPEDIRGLKSYWQGTRAAGVLTVGNYSLVDSSGTYAGRHKMIHYYNEDDGWFYPLEYAGYGGLSGTDFSFMSVGIQFERAKVRQEDGQIIILWEDFIFGNDPRTSTHPVTDLP